MIYSLTFLSLCLCTQRETMTSSPEGESQRRTENRGKPKTALGVQHEQSVIHRAEIFEISASSADVYKHSSTSPPVGLGRWALSDKVGLALQAETCQLTCGHLHSDDGMQRLTWSVCKGQMRLCLLLLLLLLLLLFGFPLIIFRCCA